MNEIPLRVIFYGKEGIGKTTTAAQFPKPILVDIEGGGRRIDGLVHRYARMKTLEQFNANLAEIAKRDDYETVIIDSVDWLETLVHKSILTKYKTDDITKAANGYGAWVEISKKAHEDIREKLDEINETKHLVLIGHPKQYMHHDADIEVPYLRETLKMHEKVSKMWMEYVDGTFYLKKDIFVVGTGKDARATETGRFLFSDGKSFDAKARVKMPAKIKLEESGMFETLQGYFSRPVSDGELYKDVLAIADKVNDAEIRKKALSEIPKHKNNNEKLKEIKTYLEGK